MLIDTMSPSEINREIDKDFALINNRSTLSRLVQEYLKERKQYKVDKKRLYPVYKELRSHAKNSWMVLIDKAHSKPHCKSESDIAVVFIVYMYTASGMRFFKINTDDGYTVFNAHFFKRYCERTCCNKAAIVDIARDYFIKNSNVIYRIQTDEKGKSVALGVSTEGYLLGEMLEEYRWIINRTFIVREQSFTDQEDIEKEIFSTIKDELDTIRYTCNDKALQFYASEVLAGIKSKFNSSSAGSN